MYIGASLWEAGIIILHWAFKVGVILIREALNEGICAAQVSGLVNFGEVCTVRRIAQAYVVSDLHKSKSKSQTRRQI